MILRLEGVTKNYPTPEGETTALLGVSLRLPKNGMVFVLGESGSGKSTFLNIIGGLDRPTSGQVSFGETDIAKLDEKTLEGYRASAVSFVFQEFNLVDSLSVEDNLSLGTTKEERQYIHEILGRLHLSGFEKRKANALSGGQRQRVAIARALLRNSPIILCDEPTGALDKDNVNEVFSLLKEVSKKRLVLIATHDTVSANDYGDRIIELKNGIVVSDVSAVEEEGEAVSFKGGKAMVDRDRIKDENLADVLEFAKNSTISREICIKREFSDTVEDEQTKSSIEFKNDSGRKQSLRESTQLGFGLGKGNHGRAALISVLLFLCLSFLGTTFSGICFSSYRTEVNEAYASGSNYVSYRKSGGGGNQNSVVDITDDDLARLKEYTGSSYFKAVGQCPIKLSENANDEFDEDRQFYLDWLKGISFFEKTAFEESGLSLSAGSYPTMETDVLLTDLHYETFAEYGYHYVDQEGGSSTISSSEISKETLIGKKIGAGDFEFTICGFADTKFDSSYFEILKEKDGALGRIDGEKADEYFDVYYSVHGLPLMLNPSLFYDEGLNVTLAVGLLDGEGQIERAFSAGTIETADGGRLTLINGSYRKVENVSHFFVPFSIIFLVLGIGVGTFASALLYGFVSTSIEANSKTVGTLRSLGVKNSSILISFAAEPILIALVSSFFSYFLCLLTTRLINEAFSYGFAVSTGVLQMPYWLLPVLLAIGFLLALLSSLLPLRKASKRSCADLVKGIEP